MNYGLIGEMLGHSFSAEIHHQLFGYDYELKELRRDELEGFITGRTYKAINVTIPYKEAVIPYLDFVDDTAKEIGAVNTIVNRDGKLYGYNTDFLGLQALILRSGISIENKSVLVLGSGGTSKTAVAVAKALGCRQVYRVSRRIEEGCITYAQAKTEYANAEIIINTTPSGMFPAIGESAVEISDFPQLQGVIDVVYNPLRTKLVYDAMQRGIPAVGGLYMLVAQAAFAAERFVGQRAEPEKIEQIFKSLYRSKENVVLVGMPGCGKSTVGKRLAEQLNCEFIDTDEKIVRQKGQSIPEIFESVGETAFRSLESKVVREVSTRQGIVIATGGGAVLNPQNVALLKENGRLYFLDRSLELLASTPDRPLSSTPEALKQRYEERYELYCRVCDTHIKADDSVDRVAEQIREDFARE